MFLLLCLFGCLFRVLCLVLVFRVLPVTVDLLVLKVSGLV